MPGALLAGGNWSNGANCGSRCRNANNSRLNVNANNGCQGQARIRGAMQLRLNSRAMSRTPWGKTQDGGAAGLVCLAESHAAHLRGEHEKARESISPDNRQGQHCPCLQTGPARQTKAAQHRPLRRELAAMCRLNWRPRKCLGFKTPYEVFLEDANTQGLGVAL